MTIAQMLHRDGLAVVLQALADAQMECAQERLITEGGTEQVERDTHSAILLQALATGCAREGGLFPLIQRGVSAAP